MGRPCGTKSVFKSFKWEEQMNLIKNYIMYGFYPPHILEEESIVERKRLKRDFRKTAEVYKIISGQLRRLTVCRKFKDSTSESKFFILYLNDY